ncbi:MAG: heme o synthase [Pseudomonadota bacterium]|nr:heme o synthase [Pseudomonadota bacterium]
MFANVIGINKVGLARDLLELCKIRVVLLIVLTAVVGMFLAPRSLIEISTVLFATVGIFLNAASAAAFNHVAEYRIDALMDRTSQRPLARGELTKGVALLFAFSLCGAGSAILFLSVNPLTAILTFCSLVGYAVVYTIFLKHATPQNIVIGGAAGAAPPVLGWTAITGYIDPNSLILFLIIFAWTPPHFWALAIARRNEYKKANIPMLPITHGVDYTLKQILLYTILLFGVSLLPFAVRMSGWVYLIGAVALNGYFLYLVVTLKFKPSNELAMSTFRYSIIYLTALFILLLLDRFII